MSLQQSVRDRLTLPAVVAPMFLCSGVAMAAAAHTYAETARGLGLDKVAAVRYLDAEFG